MKTEKNLWNDAQSMALKSVREDPNPYVEYIARHRGYGFLWSRATTGWQQELFAMYRKGEFSPNKAENILISGRALLIGYNEGCKGLGHSDIIPIAKHLLKSYKWEIRDLLVGKEIPKNNRTKILIECLNRGFVRIEDYKPESKKDYYLVVDKLDLIYPTGAKSIITIKDFKKRLVPSVLWGLTRTIEYKEFKRWKKSKL